MTPPMAPRSHGGCRIEFDGRQVGTNGCVCMGLLFFGTFIFLVLAVHISTIPRYP
ncbi:unnamed protein product [Ectocarpus sp. 12 AP-2014]